MIYLAAARLRLSSSCISVACPEKQITCRCTSSVGTVAFSSGSEHPSLFPKTENRVSFLLGLQSRFCSRSQESARVPLKRGSPLVFSQGPLWVWGYLKRTSSDPAASSRLAPVQPVVCTQYPREQHQRNPHGVV